MCGVYDIIGSSPYSLPSNGKNCKEWMRRQWPLKSRHYSEVCQEGVKKTRQPQPGYPIRCWSRFETDDPGIRSRNEICYE
jgi:hypothetical protein